MDRRQGLIGYLAVGLGVLALVVAIGGRWSGPQMGGDDKRGVMSRGEQGDLAPPQPLPTPPPAPSQERGFRPQGGRDDMARSDEHGRAWGGSGDQRGFRRGEQGGAWGGSSEQRGFRRGEHRAFGFLGGILPLAGAFLLMGLGFRLFRGSGRYGGGRRWTRGPGQPANSGWQGSHGTPHQGTPPPATPDASVPPPPHTGETRRFDA